MATFLQQQETTLATFKVGEKWKTTKNQETGNSIFTYSGWVQASGGKLMSFSSVQI